MNKISTILGLALCLGFSACNEFDLPNPPGQSNPEVPVFNVADLAIEQGAKTIDLPACVETSQNVVLAKITNASNLAEPYQYLFEVEVADNADYTDAVKIDATVEGENIVLLPSDLNSLIYKNFTKDPSDISIWTRMSAYAVYGNTKVRLGDADKYFGDNYTFLVLPFSPAQVIEPSYYLLTRTVGATAWDVTAAQQFTHTSDDSQYDNPTFMIKIDVPAGGLEWAVLPGSNFDAANLNTVYGVTEADEIDGYLVAANGETAVAGVIAEESPYSITVNMDTHAYSVAFAYDYLYVITGGTVDFNKARKLTTENFLNYTGFARLQNKWYLTGQANLDGALFKANGESTVDDAGKIKGDILMTNKADEEAEDNVAADGLYYINVNLGMMNYVATRVNFISLVGEFNGWNQVESVDFTPSSTSLVWNLKDIDLPVGQLKFCCNHAWDLDFGAETETTDKTGDLVFKGKNITIDEAGKYDIKLNFNTVPPTYTFTKK